ncbi:MAG: hypothetical protein JNM70_12235 [Anaerolineae bacterium]|nr:hypothetical protein [Anaerolineae bacterium]
MAAPDPQPSEIARGYTLEDLEAMPPEQRSLAVAEAFALSADEDFELFEAFDEFDEESCA